jgi:hypothetical protein
MINVICLKHGDKYNPMYVNNLYNMVGRHLSLPHRFVCFTDDPRGINKNVETRPLPKEIPLTGWWWKPYVFKADHFEQGDTNFFLDLDMVIVKSIDHYFNYHGGEFVGLRDVSRVFDRPEKLGSAVMRWPAGEYSDIWSKIEQNNNQTPRFIGDQDWVWSLYKNKIKFYPDKWIVSYKWEVRTRAELVRCTNRYNFIDVRDVPLDPATSILAFHGTPDPHEVMDPIIVDNWR